MKGLRASSRRANNWQSVNLLTLSVLCSWWLTACGPTQKMKVVIKMMPAQEEHFKKNVIKPFEEENNVSVDVHVLNAITDLPGYLGRNNGIHLAKVPFELTRNLASRGLIQPLEGFLKPKDIERIKNEYFLLDLGKVDGKYYYIPRKFETRTMVYIKSKVKDAVQNWLTYKEEINDVLKRHNGYGLPDAYVLENNPSDWDYFDVFVAGFYWKSAVIGGKKVPRVAHRGKYYPGTALRLIDRAYQFGASPEDILSMDHPAIVDVMSWEALYAREEIYNPRMLQEEWSGSDIWKGFASEDVYLSFMTQIDAFFIHGAGTDSMPGYLKNPEDMGVAVMPQAVSLELENGKPARTGTRAITTGGWWWGVPSSSPDPELSFKLARAITNTENQIEGCSGFGMIPVRQDILSELGLMFGGGWISDVFHVASQQLVENKFTIIPLVDEYDEIGKNYMDAYLEIGIHGSFRDGIKPQVIRELLRQKFIPKQKRILGEDYPTENAPSRQIGPREQFEGLNKDLE